MHRWHADRQHICSDVQHQLACEMVKTLSLSLSICSTYDLAFSGLVVDLRVRDVGELHVGRWDGLS